MVTYDQFMDAAEKHPDLFEQLKVEHRLKGRNSIDYALQRIKQQDGTGKTKTMWEEDGEYARVVSLLIDLFCSI